MTELQQFVLATIAIAYFVSLLSSYLFLAYCNYVYEPRMGFKLKRDELIAILTPLNAVIFSFALLVLAVTAIGWLLNLKVEKAGKPQHKGAPGSWSRLLNRND